MAAASRWTEWADELEQWLEPFMEAMGRKERRGWDTTLCPQDALVQQM